MLAGYGEPLGSAEFARIHGLTPRLSFRLCGSRDVLSNFEVSGDVILHAFVIKFFFSKYVNHCVSCSAVLIFTSEILYWQRVQVCKCL